MTVKLHTLRQKNDFARLFRRGKKVQSQIFLLAFVPNSLSHPRFAFIAPRSIDKRAVKRNMLRRRTREWIRKHPHLFTKPLDMAFLFRKEAGLMPRKKFYEELGRAISKIFD